MIKRIQKLILCAFIFSFSGYSQTYFSKRLNVAGLQNATLTFKFYNDSFYIPTRNIETNGYYSVSLLKVTNTGSIITQTRFHPNNVSFTGGEDVYIRNNKFYVPSVTDFSLKLRTGFYVFNGSCDTTFTKAYGDTTFYNLGNRILPYKKANDKLLIFGSTDSTCGVNHPGLYKPIIRVVDTNGVLSQTKLYLNTCKYRNLCNVDTTKDKGYVVCYSQYEAFSGRFGLMKLDSNLNIVWNNLYDTSSVVFAGLKTIKSGGYVLAHTHLDSFDVVTTYEKVALTKIDENGNVIWRRLYGMHNPYISAASVKELPNKDLIVCGNRGILYSPAAGQLVGFLMRTDSIGNLKWWYNFFPTSPIKDTAGQCYLYDVMQMPDKGFAAAGWVGGDGGLGTIQQTWLLRVDSMGCLVPGCTPLPTNLAEKNNNEVSIRAYPNPFKNILTIETDLKYFEESKIQLIDMTSGSILREKNLPPEHQKIEFKTEDISDGVYVIRLLQKNSTPINIKVVNSR